MSLNFVTERIATIAAGPAVAAGDALDPNVTEPVAGTIFTIPERSGTGALAGRHLLTTYFTNAANVQITGATIGFRGWYKDDRQARWYKLDAVAGATHAETYLLEAIGGGAKLYIQITAIAGLVDTDKVRLTVAAVK